MILIGILCIPQAEAVKYGAKKSHYRARPRAGCLPLGCIKPYAEIKHPCSESHYRGEYQGLAASTDGIPDS
jgi:hypothetical protein